VPVPKVTSAYSPCRRQYWIVLKFDGKSQREVSPQSKGTTVRPNEGPRPRLGSVITLVTAA